MQTAATMLADLILDRCARASEYRRSGNRIASRLGDDQTFVNQMIAVKNSLAGRRQQVRAEIYAERATSPDSNPKLFLGTLCVREHEWKSTGKSHRYISTGKCAKCTLVRSHRWMRSHPDDFKTCSGRSKRKNVESVRASNRKRMYGLDRPAYQTMLDSQSGACAICRSLPGTGSHECLHVDHCHVSGAVRGLLCGRCNRGIGCFLDNPEYLSSAILYLTRAKRMGG